jgi:hypothetical protein
MRTAAFLFAAFLAFPLSAAEPLRIQDNSFLIEEAYNQEPRVVQHIFGMTRSRDGRWDGTFTQEWPVGGLRHQLSYTLPTDHRSAAMINYRYQLAGDGDARFACSPRLSASRHQVQAMIPLSIALSDRVVTHANAGINREHGQNVISFTRARLHARAARHASVVRTEAARRRPTQQPRVGCYE